MSDPTPQASGWQPPPEYRQPPRHELAYWLAPRTSAVVPIEAGSALRTMAQNLGARRGAASVPVGLGIALACAALTNLFTSDALPGALPWMLLASVVLAGLGQYFWRRVNSSTPKPSHVSTMHASRSVAGGWAMAVLLGVPLCAIAHLVLVSQFDGTVQGALAYAGYQLALLAGITSVFFLPGYFSAHSRRDLRRHIAGNPRVRAEVEELSRSWVDPVGTMSFGPL
ncbi:hypothetical protein GCM10009715_24250 [Paeniglutamicibacter psychrophenolicus]|uniref:Uncharacterized protein n=1 Tax=Paeniglutamicibacter psychrophenolicus TaxID=257454 RepID=A0ABS4WI25_9MICC|nr:hypothetical protein [Paeniglutamicibacter psychrophenolicus]MBP2375855.1 hypothetical protein [Paeniglutamicibacter psychrophenolicus]